MSDDDRPAGGQAMDDRAPLLIAALLLLGLGFATVAIVWASWAVFHRWTAPESTPRAAAGPSEVPHG